MPHLVILRGIPGSGKSTFAKDVLVPQGFRLVEADQFLYENGEYKFDPEKLPKAHEYAKMEMLYHLRNGRDVVVANTFTRKWEVDGYISFAKEHIRDLRVTVLIANNEFVNVHNVPQKVVETMKDRFEI